MSVFFFLWLTWFLLQLPSPISTRSPWWGSSKTSTIDLGAFCRRVRWGSAVAVSKVGESCCQGGPLRFPWCCLFFSALGGELWRKMPRSFLVASSRGPRRNQRSWSGQPSSQRSWKNLQNIRKRSLCCLGLDGSRPPHRHFTTFKKGKHDGTLACASMCKLSWIHPPVGTKWINNDSSICQGWPAFRDSTVTGGGKTGLPKQWAYNLKMFHAKMILEYQSSQTVHPAAFSGRSTVPGWSFGVKTIRWPGKHRNVLFF